MDVDHAAAGHDGPDAPDAGDARDDPDGSHDTDDTDDSDGRVVLAVLRRVAQRKLVQPLATTHTRERRGNRLSYELGAKPRCGTQRGFPRRTCGHACAEP